MSWIRDCPIGMIGGPVQVFTLENWSPLIIHEAGQNTRGRPPESWGLRKTLRGVGQIVFENLPSDLWKSQRDPRYLLEKNVIFCQKSQNCLRKCHFPPNFCLKPHPYLPKLIYGSVPFLIFFSRTWNYGLYVFTCWGLQS